MKRRSRAVSPATKAQREKVKNVACIVCGGRPCHPAHVIDRSLAPSFGDDPLIVVPGCRALHEAYDNHEFDLSPFLEPRYREEAACAVRAVGLFAALRRLTGLSWQPTTETPR